MTMIGYPVLTPVRSPLLTYIRLPFLSPASSSFHGGVARSRCRRIRPQSQHYSKQSTAIDTPTIEPEHDQTSTLAESVKSPGAE